MNKTNILVPPTEAIRVKTHFGVLLTSLLATFCVAAEEAPNPDVHGDPYIPVGKLAVNPTFVATGVKPNLMWEIEYPATFQDLAIVGASGSLVTSQEVHAEVRILGGDLVDSEGRKDLPMVLWVRTQGGGNAWDLVFSGTGTEVNPSKVIHKGWLEPGAKLDLAARGKNSSGGWKDLVWTISPSHALAHGSNGTPVSGKLGVLASEVVHTFTSGILSDDQSEISIGPKDMVYFFELDSDVPGEPGFDLQDLVVLVQFKTKNNNGHGNNADGVDVSNPGQGSGGPNGEIDLSGDYDDELKIIAESSGVIEDTITRGKKAK